MNENPKKSYTVQEIKSKMEHYCSYQDRCHSDVESKIRSFFIIPQAKEEIIMGLINDGFLNEERFAKSYVRGKFGMNDWGREKIKSGLYRKNISEYLINTAMQEIDESDYTNTIKRLFERKKTIIKARNKYEFKQKMIRFLMGKGFEYEIILNTIDIE